MNFLQLCQATRLLSGAQGTGPISVTNATGYEETLVRFVRDAWVDIQNLREEWDFLKTSVTFNTSTSKDNYVFLDIFSSTTPAFKKWGSDPFIITSSGTKRYLKEVSSELLEMRYLNDISEGVPSLYAIETNNSVTLKKTPGGIYTITAKYFKSPQILALDTDVPLCQASFHNLIVYKALEKMAVFLSSPELYRNYSSSAAQMIGQLMRLNNPPKQIKPRGFA